MIDPDVIHLSNNYNPYPVQGHTVVIHATRGGHSMNPTEFEGTISWMTRTDIPEQQRVSSHWVIARDGRAARVVADYRQAWHAQEDNDNAWGIELEQGVESDGFTPEQIAKLVLVCRGYVEDFGVAPEHVGSSTQSGFVGHQETAQGRRNGKSDPGHLFPWQDFIAALTPSPVLIDGIGVRADDDATLDLWPEIVAWLGGRELKAVGGHFDDGHEETLWPK